MGKLGFVPINKISLKTAHGKFVCAEDNGNAVANRNSPGPWEKLVIQFNPSQYGLHFGQKVSFKSAHGKFLCAEDNGNAVANRDGAGPWETFIIVDPSNTNSNGPVHHEDKVAFRTAHGKYLCAEDNGNLVANRDGVGPWETFTMSNEEPVGNLLLSRKSFSLKTAHGKFLCAEDNGNAVANRDAVGPWEKFKIKYAGYEKCQGMVKYGQKVVLKTKHGKYLCAEDNGNAVANREGAGPWETFVLVDPDNAHNTGAVLGGSKVAFRTAHGKFLCAEDNGNLVANRNGAGPWETFIVVHSN